MRKREIQVKFRMSEKEYENLQRKARTSGQTQQAFILQAIEEMVIAPKEEVEEWRTLNKTFDDLVRQIRGMAANVNQMAHVANAVGMLPTQNQLTEVLCQIQSFRKECEDRWQSIRRLIGGQNRMGR